MHLLMSLHKGPAWLSLVEKSDLPQVSDWENAPAAPTILTPEQNLSTLQEQLRQLPPQQTLWVAVTQIEFFLEQALETGSDIAEAANLWLEHTRSLLAIHTQHRKQLKLFNLHQALAYPATLKQHLTQSTAETKPALALPGNLLLLAACQYTAQEPDLYNLNIQLQASVLPLCENQNINLAIPALVQDSILNSTKNLCQENELLLNQLQVMQTESAKLAGEKQNLTDENELLLTQLLNVQEELENYYLKLKEQQHQLHEAQQSLEIFKNERELFLTQLKQVQERASQHEKELKAERQAHKHATLAIEKQQAKELKSLEKELQKAKARTASAEYAGQLLQQELTSLKNSKIWKSTAPARALRKLISKPDPRHEQFVQDAALLLTSEYFDVEWYLKRYPDVAEHGVNPAEHYLRNGAAEGRQPGPLFDGEWYLQQYPDVAKAGINPLLHYIKFGIQEGRRKAPKLLTNQTPKK